MTVRVRSVEAGAVSGRLRASGTMHCATPSLALLELSFSQRVGTSVARGSWFSEDLSCGRAQRPWSVWIDSETGVAFQRGRATLTLFGISSDGVDEDTAERAVNVDVGRNPLRR